MCIKRKVKDMLEGRQLVPVGVPARLIVSLAMPQARPAAVSPGDRPWIPKATIEAAIKREFGDSGYHLGLADERWRGYTWADIMGFLLYQDDTDKTLFQSDEFDCDDYVDVTRGNIKRSLKGVQFGALWMAHRTRPLAHAVCFFYLADYYQRVICEDPQGDFAFWYDAGLWKPIMAIA